MTQITSIYKKALMEEHLGIASILESCTTGSPRKLPGKVLSDSDLNREAAEKAIQNTISKIGGVGENGKKHADIMDQCLEVASFLANRQEDQRVRRDTRIMRTNHKRLMLGCLQTLYWRDQALVKSRRV